MKNFLKILLFVSFFIAPLITNAQRNKKNSPEQEDAVIWRSGTYPFTETRITKAQQKEKLDSLVNNSDYIVDGSLREVMTFVDENNKVWHVTQLEIYLNLKGDIPENKIYFLWQDHTLYYDNYHHYYRQQDHAYVPSFIYFNFGIFFLRKSQMPVDLIKPDTTVRGLYSYYDKSFSASENMSLLYEPTDLCQWGISYTSSPDYYYGPYWMKFIDNKWDIFNSLNEQYNLEIPGYSKTFGKKELLDSLVNDTIINNIPDIVPENMDMEQMEKFKKWIYGDRVIKEREFIDSLPIVNVSITPNPSHGQFYVNSDSPIQKISVYTNSLVVVKDIYVDEKDCKKKLVDLRKNKKGVYIIKIETQSGITTKEVILK